MTFAPEWRAASPDFRRRECGPNRVRASDSVAVETGIAGSSRAGLWWADHERFADPQPRAAEPVPDSRASRECSRGLSENGAKASRSSLLPEWSREIILRRERGCGGNLGKCEQKPMPSTSEASHSGGKGWEARTAGRPSPVSFPFVRQRGLPGECAKASAPPAAATSGSPRRCHRSSGRIWCRGRRAG
jgi:hypothetical protein